MSSLSQLALALVLASPATLLAQSGNFTAVFNEPFATTIFNPCNAETAVVTGRVFFETTVVSDAAGGTHTALHTHITGSGVGDQGNRYVFVDNTGVISTELPPSGVVEQTVALTMNTIGVGPTPDFDIHILIHSTIAPDGSVSSSVVNVVFDPCR